MSDLDRTISQQKQSCTDARVRLVCVGGLIVRAHSALPCMCINWAVSTRFKGLRCCYEQTNTVSVSQRAVCTVPFLMAELYRCPSAVDDVRESVIVRAGSALPSICMGCTIYCLLCANIYGKTHLLRDCPESKCLAESRPPPVLSLITHFRAGFAPTSVLADDGSVRRWNLH